MGVDKNFFTNFGFRKVPFNDKANLVREVFDDVAKNYDIMNDFMSLGIHRIWKKEFVKMLTDVSLDTLLDVGGGTGDISLEFMKNGGRGAYVVDINPKMLSQGRAKAINNGYLTSLEFLCANAEALPFKSNSIDCYSTAFCIRNVTDINSALAEAYRVLKSGSKFFCLEFSKVDNPLLAQVYDFWSFKIIPNMGQCIAKNKNAYAYLVESIRQFPAQEDFANMIREVGFKNVGYKNLTFGVASIHYGEK